MRVFPAWLADAVTFLRIALLPLFVLAAEAAQAAGGAGGSGLPPRTLALALLLVIAASDKVDGYVARRSTRPPTRGGAVLDAAADRLVQWVGILYFTLRASPAFTSVSPWLIVCLVGREVLLLTAWARLRQREEVPVEHESHGRAATVLVFATLIAATVSAPRIVVDLLSAGAGAAVLYSAIQYASRLVAAREGPPLRRGTAARVLHDGVIAGGLAALVAILVVGGVDVAAGRGALHTPAAMGALLLGAGADAGAATLAYTGLHVATSIVVGVLAALQMIETERHRSLWYFFFMVLIAAGVYVVTGLGVFAVEIGGAVGWPAVVAGSAVWVAVITGYLAWAHRWIVGRIRRDLQAAG